MVYRVDPGISRGLTHPFRLQFQVRCFVASLVNGSLDFNLVESGGIFHTHNKLCTSCRGASNQATGYGSSPASEPG